MPHPDGRQAVLVLLGAELVSAGHSVTDEKADEQEGERDQQAVLIDDEPEPAAAHRPRRVRVGAVLVGVFVTGIIVIPLGFA